MNHLVLEIYGISLNLIVLKMDLTLDVLWLDTRAERWMDGMREMNGARREGAKRPKGAHD